MLIAGSKLGTGLPITELSTVRLSSLLVKFLPHIGARGALGRRGLRTVLNILTQALPSATTCRHRQVLVGFGNIVLPIGSWGLTCGTQA